ncbi:hypothetical protein NXY56_004499 [Leishmania guyanensis]|uniref:Uncharacterized protein n=1 Tax=Leishmania guyanensis TaxID=5670 RepID=A0A1E1J0H8_LEIGU|nr:hypothetical protein, conserved [Leishmania guyanensis]
MSRASSVQRRPHSSAPGEVSSAGAPVRSNARYEPARRRASAYSSWAAYFPTQASLFRDSYGFSLACTAVSRGRHYPPSHGGLHANASGGGRGVGSHHHDVTRSPGVGRPPPPPRRAVTAGAPAVRSPAGNGSGAADAIAFQYYSQQRQRRGHLRSASSLHEFETTATPVRWQPFTPSGGGLSAPARPAGGSAGASSPLLVSHFPSCPPLHICDEDLRARLYHHPSALPSPTEHKNAIRDTSTSLASLTPSMEGGSWPVQLSLSQYQQYEGLVRLLAQLPAAQAHRVLLAAIHQYEAQRLLQYYGGLHALSEAEGAPCTEPRSAAASSLASPSGKMPSGRRQDDGRSALFEALQTRLHDMQRADLAAQALSPFTVAARHRQRRGGSGTGGPASEQLHVNHFITASPPTVPPTTAARRPQLARHHTPQDSPRSQRSAASEQCSGSGAACAPRQLRSRVLASRVAKPRTRRAEQEGRRNRSGAVPCDAPGSPQCHSTPTPQQDFMQTIKPPHRHGLAGALQMASWAAAEALPAAHDHDSRERGATSPATQRVAVAGLVKAAGEEDPHRPVLTEERSDGMLSPPALAFTTTSITGKAELNANIDWPLTAGATLSPGAAAARRVYWEQQQREMQQQQRPSSRSRVSGEGDGGEVAEGSELLSDIARRSHVTHDESDAVCRYPGSSPIDRYGTISGKPGALSPGSISLEDSVQRSEVLPLACVSAVTPGAPGPQLGGTAVPGAAPSPLPGIPAVPEPPPPQIPGVLLPPRVTTVMTPLLERANCAPAAMVDSAGASAVFITDFNGASIPTLLSPKTRLPDRERDDSVGTPAQPSSNSGAFLAKVDHASAAVDVSSGLYGQSRYDESSSGAGHATLPLQSKLPEGPDAQHLLSSPPEGEEDAITASSISSEPLSQEQAADDNYDGVTGLAAHTASRPAAAESQTINESADEFKLPWEI